MGEAGHVGAKFRRVLRGGNYQAAYLLALELPRVSLEDALALTVLAGEQAPGDFPKLARKLLARVAVESRPPLADLARLAGLMADAEAGRLHPSKLFGPVERVLDGRPLVAD